MLLIRIIVINETQKNCRHIRDGKMSMSVVIQIIKASLSYHFFLEVGNKFIVVFVCYNGDRFSFISVGDQFIIVFCGIIGDCLSIGVGDQISLIGDHYKFNIVFVWHYRRVFISRCR